MNIERLLAFVMWSLILAPAAAQDPTEIKPPLTCVEVNGEAIDQIATGQFKEAEGVLSAVVTRTNELGPLCAGLVLGNLAAAMRLSGRFAEAQGFAERSINVLDRSLGTDAPALLGPLHTLAAARLEQGNIGLARSAFQRMQRIHADRPADRALVHGIAATLLQMEGRLIAAEPEYFEALRALEEAGQGSGANAASMLLSLGSLYIDQGRLDEAGRMLERAMTIFDSAGDTVLLERIEVGYLRAALHARQREWQKAEEEMQSAIAMADRVNGLDPHYHAFLLANYAQLLRNNHQRGAARSIEARAAAFRGKRSSGGVVDVTELSLKLKANPK